MVERQYTDALAPRCPVCAGTMNLKTVYKQEPADHLIFKCADCGVEYPVIAGARGTPGSEEQAGR